MKEKEKKISTILEDNVVKIWLSYITGGIYIDVFTLEKYMRVTK